MRLGLKLQNEARVIWHQSEIPTTTLLRVGDTLFGSFKVLDRHLATPLNTTPSYIDYGYGSDTGRFAGVHRFSVSRTPANDGNGSNDPAGEKHQQQVEIKLQGFRCNPAKDVDSAAGYLTWFHYCYAKLLFADGIRSCLRGR